MIRSFVRVSSFWNTESQHNAQEASNSTAVLQYKQHCILYLNTYRTVHIHKQSKTSKVHDKNNNNNACCHTYIIIISI